LRKNHLVYYKAMDTPCFAVGKWKKDFCVENGWRAVSYVKGVWSLMLK
jgi:hypothetical protein